MVIGNLKKDLHQIESMGQDLRRVADYIVSTDLSSKIDGKHLIDGNRIYYNLMTYSTTFAANRPAEAHWEHIDFQYMVSGEESVGWTLYDKGMQVLEKYDEAKDVVTFFNVRGESFFNLRAGMYALFFPNDVHRPGIQAERSLEVRKAVFKIRL